MTESADAVMMIEVISEELVKAVGHTDKFDVGVRVLPVGCTLPPRNYPPCGKAWY